jgi:hypothetical protein
LQKQPQTAGRIASASSAISVVYDTVVVVVLVRRSPPLIWVKLLFD